MVYPHLLDAIHRALPEEPTPTAAIRKVFHMATMLWHSDHAEFLNNIPVHLVWGTMDNVTPIAGPAGQFYMDLAKNPEGKVSLSLVDAGHIPFDEIPDCNNFMIEWLDGIVASPEYDNASKANIFPWAMSLGKLMQS